MPTSVLAAQLYTLREFTKTPADIARQVVVLASDELSGHVTGQVVTIAGGMEGRILHES